MPSISHRTSLGQATPHRAESGSTALPTGFTRGIVGWLVRWRDVGLGDAEARRSTVAPTCRDRPDPKGLLIWPTIF
jgi:hypothetical protein